MGEFQAIYKYLAVVVVLVACHVVITQGRQIKALNQHSSLDKDTSIYDTSIYGHVLTSAKKALKSPTIPNHHVNAASEDSNAEYLNAYRPTTPGNSPGVGHRKFEENKDIKAKMVVQNPPDVEYSLAEGSKTDIRPTDPGHSPGVGHAAHQNNNN